MGFLRRILFCSVTALLAFAYFYRGHKETHRHQYPSSFHFRLPPPLIWSHRGSRYFSAENTIESHQLARYFGADVFETDVRLTKDNILVIFHDESLDRVADLDVLPFTLNSKKDQTGHVKNFSLAEIKKVDPGWQFTSDGGKTFPMRGKTQIPTLAEFLDVFQDVPIAIEIKDEDEIAGQQLYEELKKRHQSGQAIEEFISVSARYCAPLKKLRQLMHSEKTFSIPTASCESEAIPLIFFGNILGFYDAVFSSLEFLGMFELPPILQFPAVSGFHDLATADFIQAVHRMDQKVMWWIVNDLEQASYLFSLNSDGICSDRVDLMYPHLRPGARSNPFNVSLGEDFLAKYYFPPEQAPSEVHTCVTLTCIILQLLPLKLVFFVVLIPIAYCFLR